MVKKKIFFKKPPSPGYQRPPHKRLMKTLMQLIATFVMIALVTVGGYYYLERDYIKKIHIEETNKVLDSLVSE